MTEATTRPILLLVGGAGAVDLNIDMAVQALAQARGLRTHITASA
ncbi:MAG: hypothetical protein ACRD0H_07370 [Actinomycetes bacterium]